MEPACKILLYGDSLYLQSLAAGLQEFEEVQFLLPGSSGTPDLILMVWPDQDLGLTREALVDYPDTPILQVDMQKQRLTVLRPIFLSACTIQDLREAIQSLLPSSSPTQPKEIEHGE